MFDRNRLEYEMRRNKVSVDDMLKACNLSKSAWYRKLKGTTQFTLSEIEIISNCLNQENPEAIFFANEVS